MKPNYKTTIYACFAGYAVQAVINNFVPLLFLTFHNTYNIPLSRITLLVTMNFCVQLAVDLISAGFADKIGYRTAIVAAHVFSAAGLVCLTFLPSVLSSPFTGLLISIFLYAIGGGLIEVLVSPIMESCPTDNKAKAMSLLHSFYCWGHVAVVFFSTAFFSIFGIENWKTLALIWAIIPLINGIIFTKAPIAPLIEDGGKGMTVRELFRSRFFWIFMIMMICSGAGEQAVSQWSSALAEKELGVSKTVGDLTGPMMFAVLMGSSRAFYGKYGHKIKLNRFMILSSILCAVSYLLISLSPIPAASLIGCGLCGLSVGIMWPGSFSTASACLKRGGTAMFALLALAGDIGCSVGPTIVGMVSDAIGGNIKPGILVGIIFPIILIISIMLLIKFKKSEKG